MISILELPNGTNDLTPVELTSEYLRMRRIYRDLLKRAKKVSRGSGGILAPTNRVAYASLLFTRIVVICKSIDQLLPDCKPREHWDFSSVASLTRNLAEAFLWYFWLCIDEVEEVVRDGRFVLLYLHDHGSRKRLFEEVESTEPDVAYADLLSRFEANAYLRTFDASKRKEALKGHKTPFAQDDLLDKIGVERNSFRVLYRFFSQHTHTGPLSFMRMIDHDRGTGVETAHEKRYMIVALEFANGVLKDAIDGQLQLFPDAETRAPHLTDAEVVRRVEQNQGRSSIHKHRG
ncbi:hypothetical protein IP88_15870 [alpha proteobacterium AAP81b]|nr:hypothetical protein IP88_15870 [alpha proteobacterium AAP81b]